MYHAFHYPALIKRKWEGTIRKNNNFKYEAANAQKTCFCKFVQVIVYIYVPLKAYKYLQLECTHGLVTLTDRLDMLRTRLSGYSRSQPIQVDRLVSYPLVFIYLSQYRYKSVKQESKMYVSSSFRHQGRIKDAK